MSHLSLSDETLEAQFAEGVLPPALFSHEAHLRMAWIHLRKYGLETAGQHLCVQIRAFAEKQGEGDEFDQSLTLAAVRVVNRFQQQSETNHFPDFLQQFPQLSTHFRELLQDEQNADGFSDLAILVEK